jgi:tRNA-splicing endonuclease subunit Sen2
MTTKKSNALKRQIYGTPLPLPCLQESSLKQQPHQQNKSSPSSSAPPVVHSVATTYPNWTPLDTLFELLGRLYNLCRATGHAPPLNLIQAEFHPQGQSVWVKGDKEMEILFRQGFFGKGTLSRSEATWKQRHTAGTQGMHACGGYPIPA